MKSPELESLLLMAGLPAAAADHCAITGSDPVLHTRYRVGEVAAVALAGVGACAAELWALRSGRRQQVSVSTHAAAISLRGNRYFQLNGETLRRSDPLHGFYRVRDGRWIFLHCNLASVRERNLSVLRVPAESTAVAHACEAWDGAALEDAIFAAGGCAGYVRAPGEWARLDAAAAVAAHPLLEILRIGDAPPQPLPAGAQPLAGVRVLDLTRVIAGPVCGRTLAAHGADVLKINRRDLPGYGKYELDMSLGKRSACLDLRDAAQADTLRALVRNGDVFLQSYRPGALAARGFSPEEVAALRPGIVYATLNAWGHAGPWAARRGFDSVVQAVNGMAHTLGTHGRPALMPGSVMDYITGYLLAMGIMAALSRRVREGGSWLVRTSLAGAGRCIAERGLLELAALDKLPQEPPAAEIEALSEEMDAPDGRIRYLKPALHLSETPPRWTRPPVPMGTHAPAWPERQN